jgi:hypothetical protein
VIFWT